MTALCRHLNCYDFGTCHLYPELAPAEPPAAFGAQWIREHIEAGQRAGKPMLIEEYGLKIDAGHAFRNAAVQTWLEQVVTRRGRRRAGMDACLDWR
jgi:mannan endo-1,4-beta-mannosidase